MVRIVPGGRNSGLLKTFESTPRDMGQLFDALWHSLPNPEPATPSWPAPAALWEANGSFYFEAELPGVKREDLELTLEKNVLRISAVRSAPEEERTYWHNERSYGRVERSVTLPETVDPESIEAELKEGVLRVKLSKRPEAVAKKIEIRS